MEIAITIIVIWLLLGVIGNKRNKKKKHRLGTKARRTRIVGKSVYINILRSQKRKGRYR